MKKWGISPKTRKLILKQSNRNARNKIKKKNIKNEEYRIQYREESMNLKIGQYKVSIETQKKNEWKKKRRKTEQNIWDNIKLSNRHVIELPEQEERDNGAK